MINIKKICKAVSYLVLACCISACASLTKSQLAEVNTFGQLTKNFSIYPSKVVNSFNAIHQEQQLYLANALQTVDEH
jgi:hypothetical protein